MRIWQLSYQNDSFTISLHWIFGWFTIMSDVFAFVFIHFFFFIYLLRIRKWWEIFLFRKSQWTFKSTRIYKKNVSTTVHRINSSFHFVQTASCIRIDLVWLATACDSLHINSAEYLCSLFVSLSLSITESIIDIQNTKTAYKIVAFRQGFIEKFSPADIEFYWINKQFCKCMNVYRGAWITSTTTINALTTMGTEVINANFDVLQEELEKAKSTLKGLNDNIRRINGRETSEQLRLDSNGNFCVCAFIWCVWPSNTVY